MLSPARPDRNDARYEEKMCAYRQARRHQRRHPEAWGMQGARVTPPEHAPSREAGKRDPGPVKRQS